MDASANSPRTERELSVRRRLSGESYVLLKAERDKQVALGNNFGRVRAEKFLASYGPAHQYGKQAISTALECIQEGKAYKVAEGRGPKKTKANPKVQQRIKQMLTENPRSIENSCRRITEKLKAEKIPASKTTVSRVIKEAGYKVRRPQKSGS